MELLKMLSGSEILAQVICFFLLLFLLKKFAWGKILGFLDQRREKIAAEFKNIEDIRRDVSSLKADYEAKAAQIQAQAQAKINEAIEEGRKFSEEMRKKAYEQAQDIIEAAKKDVKYELARVRQELKDEIVDISLKATEVIIGDKFTDADDRRVVEKFIDDLEKMP